MRFAILVLTTTCMLTTRAAAAQEACGVPGFREAAALSLPAPAIAITTADLNHDGRHDLVTLGPAPSDAVFVRLGAGDGTFGPPTTILLGGSSRSMALADFNRDGHLDIAAGFWIPFGTGVIEVRLGDGRGRFGAARMWSLEITAEAMVAADVTGDGNVDLVMTGRSGGQGWDDHVWMLPGTGSGAFGSAVPVATLSMPTSTWWTPGPDGLATGDFNGDAQTDVAVITLSPNSNDVFLEILLGTGAGAFIPGTISSLGEGFGNWIGDVGDFGADGRTDVTIVGVSGADVRIFPGSDGGVAPPRTLAATPFAMERIVDLNGDSILDLLLDDASNGRDQAMSQATGAVMLGDGRGGFGPPVPFHRETSTVSASDFAIADFDQDGRLDLASISYYDSDVAILLSTCGNEADLAVAVSASADTVTLPGAVTYTVEVTNHGPDIVAGVLDFTVGTRSFQSITATRGACGDRQIPGGQSDPRHLFCQGFVLTAGATMSATIVAPMRRGTVTARAVVSSTGDPNPANNAAEVSVRGIGLGGYALRISAAGGSVALTWTAGETQAGYHVVRYIGSTPTTLTQNAPLPAGATSFVDSTPVSDALNCYAVTPLDVAGVSQARSDVLCLKQGASAAGAPPFVLQRNGRIAHLSWEGAGDVLIAIAIYNDHPLHPPRGATSIDHDNALRSTCYWLFAFVVPPEGGYRILGNSDALCAGPAGTVPQ